MESLNFREHLTAGVVRNRAPHEQKFEPRGRFKVEHYRSEVLLATYEFPNDITNEGKNSIFDTMFNSAAQVATWSMGLVNLTGFSALAATDTMASHPGWTEFTTYSQGSRVTWASGASAAQTITNATPATFDITGTGTVKGIFIASNNTKGGTTGKLWTSGLFLADVPVVNSDQIKCTYTLNA